MVACMQCGSCYRKGPRSNTRHTTYTLRDCFHLGLWVLLHFSVFFDWPSTATSTYGLGPNQFFLFSLSLADRTAGMSARTHTHTHTMSVIKQEIPTTLMFIRHASYLGRLLLRSYWKSLHVLLGQFRASALTTSIHPMGPFFRTPHKVSMNHKAHPWRHQTRLGLKCDNSPVTWSCAFMVQPFTTAWLGCAGPTPTTTTNMTSQVNMRPGWQVCIKGIVLVWTQTDQ